MSGKGSKFRPVNREQFNSNYDDIFGKKEPQKKKQTKDNNETRHTKPSGKRK